MATFTKRGTGWRAQVARLGIRASDTFSTKAEAVAWAAQKEADIIAGKRGGIPNKTFGDLLDRYSLEVSEYKEGRRWEQVRIEKIKRDPIAKVKLSELNGTHFAEWRDRSLKGDVSKGRKLLKPASVRREWNLLNAAVNISVREWKWLTENPLKEVRRPKPGKARDRRISTGEIGRLMVALGYDYASTPETDTATVGAAFLFAIETAMRMGEIAGIKPKDLDLKHRTVHLPKTKNGTSRTVALSSEAVRIIKQLRANDDSVFGLNTTSIDALFRKGRARALIDNLHFHDTRHEAITRLAKKLDVLDLARMVGVKDLKILMVYYNETAAEIAKRLD